MVVALWNSDYSVLQTISCLLPGGGLLKPSSRVPKFQSKATTTSAMYHAMHHAAGGVGKLKCFFRKVAMNIKPTPNQPSPNRQPALSALPALQFELRWEN